MHYVKDQKKVKSMEIIQKILCLKNRGRREGRKGGGKVEREEGEEGVGRGGREREKEQSLERTIT